MNIVKIMFFGIMLFLAALTIPACSTNLPPDAREPVKSETDSTKQAGYRHFVDAQSHTNAWLESERRASEARRQLDERAFWRKQRLASNQ